MSRDVFELGPWTVDLSRGILTREGVQEKLEPKVADLLSALLDAEGEVVSRGELFAKLWSDVTVGEDTLNRVVFKLRRALGDDPKNPVFLETVPKRGYRLMKAAIPHHALKNDARRHAGWLGLLAVAAAAAFLGPTLFAPGVEPVSSSDLETTSANPANPATGRYMSFTRADNEAAIDLYQRELAQSTATAQAEAGLAAALVQRVIRWPEAIGSAERGADTLGSALARGLTTTPQAREVLKRASLLAERAVRRNPRNANAWRSLGLVRSAQNRSRSAFEAYENALRFSPNDWKVKINLAELYGMRGQDARAYKTLVEAYEDMGRAYDDEPKAIAQWRAPLGVLIAKRDLSADRLDNAEAWYRRVLTDEPYHEEATLGLARLLSSTDRNSEMRALCERYENRTGTSLDCEG